MQTFTLTTLSLNENGHRLFCRKRNDNEKRKMRLRINFKLSLWANYCGAGVAITELCSFSISSDFYVLLLKIDQK